jgi:hypothetical protein
MSPKEQFAKKLNEFEDAVMGEHAEDIIDRFRNELLSIVDQYEKRIDRQEQLQEQTRSNP